MGALVDGFVRRVDPFGVFIGIRGTRISGLLHVSNITRSSAEGVQVIMPNNRLFHMDLNHVVIEGSCLVRLFFGL